MQLESEQTLVQWKQFLVVIFVTSNATSSMSYSHALTVVARNHEHAKELADAIAHNVSTFSDVSWTNVEKIAYLCDVDLFETTRKLILDDGGQPRRRIRTRRDRNS